jgi:hypothetical protein
MMRLLGYDSYSYSIYTMHYKLDKLDKLVFLALATRLFVLCFIGRLIVSISIIIVIIAIIVIIRLIFVFLLLNIFLFDSFRCFGHI